MRGHGKGHEQSGTMRSGWMYCPQIRRSLSGWGGAGTATARSCCAWRAWPGVQRARAPPKMTLTPKLTGAPPVWEFSCRSRCRENGWRRDSGPVRGANKARSHIRGGCSGEVGDDVVDLGDVAQRSAVAVDHRCLAGNHEMDEVGDHRCVAEGRMLPLAKPTELDDANPGRFTLSSRTAGITLSVPRRSEHVEVSGSWIDQSADRSAPRGRRQLEGPRR